jgi:hypothetical protein
VFVSERKRDHDVISTDFNTSMFVIQIISIALILLGQWKPDLVLKLERAAVLIQKKRMMMPR